ncbi:MAG: hypothetical protein CFE24_13130 [Flavobacterium sp. BFFFF2]|nr:MAG: hypothetical protein CFE24_13130 [Flavobacterium sp. BFFFF2]
MQYGDISEWLDAAMVSEKLYDSKSIIENIKLEKRGIPNQHNLYLVGIKNLTIALFDSVLSPKMGNK